MNSIIYFLVTGALVSSARRALDVDRYPERSRIDPYHSFDDRYIAQNAERRNVDYRSNANLNQETFSDSPVYINQPAYNNQHSSDYFYDTESDYIAPISKKIDKFHSRGSDENEFKLRTNVYPAKRYEKPEFSTETFNDNKQPGSKTLVGDRDSEETRSLPKEEDGEEEIPWVWGSEPEPKANTKNVDDDLDDRAAFDGSWCATGYAKVYGICVERH